MSNTLRRFSVTCHVTRRQNYYKATHIIPPFSTSTIFVLPWACQPLNWSFRPWRLHRITSQHSSAMFTGQQWWWEPHMGCLFQHTTEVLSAIVCHASWPLNSSAALVYKRLYKWMLPLELGLDFPSFTHPFTSCEMHCPSRDLEGATSLQDGEESQEGSHSVNWFQIPYKLILDKEDPFNEGS